VNIILRQVYIYKEGELIYSCQFGKALTQEDFTSLFKQLRKDAMAAPSDKIEYHDYYKYRITYATEKKLDLMFLFVTGLTDSSKDIKTELLRCKREFLNLFGDIIKTEFDSKTFEVFDPTIDVIHKNLRPKISLVGFSGVGKTTITRLIRAEEIPMEHIPTITGDIATIKIGKLHFHLWDFAGQEQFSYLWNNFVKGSDAVLLITDSTLENIEKSRFFLDLIKDEAPHAHTAIIGNKQDLSDALPVTEIENILGLKTYKMIANKNENRDKMITIIADILEMSSEVSPLLKPLIERDKLLQDAELSLNEGNFQNSLTLFEKIADLCLDLGDDSLGNEFNEKAQKIKEILVKMETTPVEIVKPKEEGVQPASVKSTSPEPKVAPKPAIPKPPVIIIPDAAEPKAAPKPAIPKSPAIKKPSVPEPKAAPKPAIPKPPAIKKPSVPEPKAAPKPAIPKPPTIKKTTVPESKVAPKPTSPKSQSTQPKLTINLADFKIKPRPTNILSAKTTGPKQSLTVSPFSAIKQEETQPKPYTTKPKSPYQQPLPDSKRPSPPMQIPQPPIPPKAPPQTSIPKPMTQPTPAKTKPPITIISDQGGTQKDELEKTLMDLKIKFANISKMELDLDMKEISGEITSEEFNEKSQKIKAIKENISKQIEDIQNLLNSFSA